MTVYDPGLVTPEWLTSVLAVDGARVVELDAETIGTGQVGNNVRFRLSWVPDGAGPPSVVGKFASKDETSRATGIATKTYETEVAFYRDIAGTVEISRPHCYFADHVPGTADVVLVLEDMAPAVQGDQITGCSLAQAELAVDEAARLHGPRWGDPTLTDIAWLSDRMTESGGMAAMIAMVWPGFLERYRDTLDERAIDVGERLLPRVGELFPEDPGPLTVTHVDYRLDNMLFASAEGGRPLTVVDWQTARLGVGTGDVSYFVSAAFADPAVRRTHEGALVRRYHDGLLAYGINGYPFDRCWEDYRRASFSGLLMAVFASMMVGQTDRGDAMFMAMANGAAAQIIDLDVEALFP